MSVLRGYEPMIANYLENALLSVRRFVYVLRKEDTVTVDVFRDKDSKRGDVAGQPSEGD